VNEEQHSRRERKNSRGLLMHSKGIDDISTITWRCQSQERCKSETNLYRESVRNHEEKNVFINGFE
jgi:hypothetical protein